MDMIPTAFACLSTNGLLISMINQKSSLSHISGSAFYASGAHIMEETVCIHYCNTICVCLLHFGLYSGHINKY